MSRRERTTDAPSLAKSAAMWRALWRTLPSADRRRVGDAVVAMVIGSLATASVPLVVGHFVDQVYVGGNLVGLTNAVVPLLLLAAAFVLIGTMELIKHQKVHTVTTRFESTSRQVLYTKLLRWDLQRFQEDTDGTIYGRANRSIEGAVQLIKLGTADLLPSMLVAAFAIVIAVANYGLIGVMVAAVVPTGFGLVSWQIRSQNGIRIILKNAKERIDGQITALLAMIKVIRTSGTESYFDARVATECDHLRSTEMRHHQAMGVFDIVKTANEALWLVGTLLVALRFSSPTPGDLAGLVLIYLATTKPLRELHRVIDESSEAALSAADLVADLEVPLDLSFAPSKDGDRNVPEAASRRLRPAPPAIEMIDLTFRYPGSLLDTLRGVTASIGSGERVGIVGPSGCGKSTLLDIAARLHHGHGGQMRVHGREVTDLSRTELTGLIGYVGQEPTLFPGTIRDNLILGRSDIDENAIIAACIRANIMSDVSAMRNGFDTWITQRGGNLSGGQRQRLCIARALLNLPPVLLLDEPTSALDVESEAVVQEAIDAIEDVTMLVVAHRLSTMRSMDRILVLAGGRIVEDGSFAALQRKGGPFARMLERERFTG